MSISDRLDEIAARCDAATEGPWEWEATNPSMAGAKWNLRIAEKPGIRLAVSEYQHGTDNAEFIAHARTDVPRLVAALRAVLGRHKRVQHRSGTTICNGCWGDDDGELAAVEYPCPTVRAVGAALGEEA